VVNIGCIECGVSSNIVGIFDSQEHADAVVEMLSEKCGWREGGQNAFQAFPLPPLNEIADEYREHVKWPNDAHKPSGENP
jgi:hypothetical protein